MRGRLRIGLGETIGRRPRDRLPRVDRTADRLSQSSSLWRRLQTVLPYSEISAAKLSSNLLESVISSGHTCRFRLSGKTVRKARQQEPPCQLRAPVNRRKRWYPATALDDLLGIEEGRSTIPVYIAVWTAFCPTRPGWSGILSNGMASCSAPSSTCCFTI